MISSSVLNNPVSRYAILALVAFAALFAFSPKAEARGVWCAGDPAIIVNGSVVDVNVHIPLENLKQVEYVDVKFHVPSNAKVLLTLNDSLLFKAKVSYVKDLPPAYGLFGTPVTVDVKVVHKGNAFPIATTTLAVGGGSHLWKEGVSNKTHTVKTWGLLNIRL